MQTMPAKNRTALVVGGILLALVVGIFALRSAGREADPMLDPDQASVMPDPIGPITADPGTDVTTDPVGVGETPVTADPGSSTPVMAPDVPAVYVVRTGDTLYSISQYFYGSHVYAGDIEQLNSLENPNRIMAGDELLLPRPEELPGYAD